MIYWNSSSFSCDNFIEMFYPPRLHTYISSNRTSLYSGVCVWNHDLSNGYYTRSPYCGDGCGLRGRSRWKDGSSACHVCWKCTHWSMPARGSLSPGSFIQSAYFGDWSGLPPMLLDLPESVLLLSMWNLSMASFLTFSYREDKSMRDEWNFESSLA